MSHLAREVDCIKGKSVCNSLGPKMFVNLLNWPYKPYLMNGFSHHYHLGQSTFIFRGVRSDFSILFNFSIKIL